MFVWTADNIQPGHSLMSSLEDWRKVDFVDSVAGEDVEKTLPSFSTQTTTSPTTTRIIAWLVHLEKRLIEKRKYIVSIPARGRVMAALEPNGRDELKTQFITREGTYHLMTLAEYSRPNRVGYANAAATTTAPVKVESLMN